MDATLTFVIGCAGGATVGSAVAWRVGTLRARASARTAKRPAAGTPTLPEVRRVSPHFLNNALAAVSSFVEVDPGRASAMLADLGEYLRYALDDDRRRVSLADELAFVRTYVRIEQARFGDRVDVRITTDAASAQIPVRAGAVQAAVQRALEREHRVGGEVRIRVAATGAPDGVEVRVATAAPSDDDEVVVIGA